MYLAKVIVFFFSISVRRIIFTSIEEVYRGIKTWFRVKINILRNGGLLSRCLRQTARQDLLQVIRLKLISMCSTEGKIQTKRER